jgi:hypothetical protein
MHSVNVDQRPRVRSLSRLEPTLCQTRKERKKFALGTLDHRLGAGSVLGRLSIGILQVAVPLRAIVPRYMLQSAQKCQYQADTAQVRISPALHQRKCL